MRCLIEHGRVHWSMSASFTFDATSTNMTTCVCDIFKMHDVRSEEQLEEQKETEYLSLSRSDCMYVEV